MWQAYYASVSFMDEQLGRVIAELDRLGLRDTTAIVFTTDHGYHLGEHGFWQKVNLHEEVARVPLMVSAPGMKPGRTQSLVELVDLYPTCSDLLGLPIPAALQGKSLARILREPAVSVRDTALSVHHTRPYAAIRAADWHYMNYGDEGEELYDMTKDPHQYTNAVTDAEYAPLLKKARAAFQARIEKAGLRPPRAAVPTRKKAKKVPAPRKTPAAARASRDRPNIILIMADDMGYECVRANGGTSFQTPALDELAKTGVRFEHCYSQPLCTPSRVQIMTGIYNVRNYVKFGVLDRKQRTFAQVLKEAGYATCIAGKWQLGNEGDAPQHFGFDESCLWQHTRGARDRKKRDTRYPNPHVEVNGKAVDYTNGEYGPDLVSDFLCEFMARNKDKPLLAYYPMILPHNPFVPTPDSKDPKCRDNQTNFQDMVAHIDKVVGKIAAKLDELGIRDNTLVLFTGDNGTAGAIRSQLNGREV